MPVYMSKLRERLASFGATGGDCDAIARGCIARMESEEASAGPGSSLDLFARRLRLLMQGRDELSGRELDALTKYLFASSKPEFRGAIPVDIHRSAWLLNPEAKSSWKVDSEYVQWQRLIPSYPIRSIDAYLATHSPARKEPLANHVHPGDQIVHVIKGTLVAKFFGGWQETLNAGDTILLDGLHPHSIFRPEDVGETRFLSVFADHFGASAPITTESFGVIDDPSEPRSLSRTFRIRVALALHAIPASIRKVQDMSTIGYDRLADLRRGLVEPKPREVRELAYLLRLPLRFFYEPLEASHGRCPFEIIRSSQLIECFSEAGTPQRPDLLVDRSADGRITWWPIGPSAGREQDQRLRLGAFRIDEGEIYDRPTPKLAANDRSEQLLFVLGGDIGVRYKDPATEGLRNAPPNIGILQVHDALWYQSPIAPTFAAQSPGGSALCFQLHALPTRHERGSVDAS